MSRKFSIAAVVLSLALSSSAAISGVINFTSGTGDGCKVANDGDGKFNDNCSLTANEFGSWVDAADFNAAAGSTGAAWVQAAGSYIRSNLNDYRIFELDLSKTGEDWKISSLWLSVDDDVRIKVGGQEVWNSNGITTPWAQPIDVIAALGSAIEVGGNQRLNFYVHDIGNENQGPTGIIFAGTASSVPEPGSLALLALGLAGLGFSRRKQNA